ncbi:MAG: pseudouridylate synthase [Fusobacteriaceae bacterium]
MNLNLRFLENSDKLGFMFYIVYDGKEFHCFDEMSGKNSVKSTFKSIMNEIGFSWAKGIQQAGRTDAKVSANENILYVSSRYFGDLEKLKKDFNQKAKGIKIKNIIKTIPNLSFPEMVEQREYIYSYPKKKISLTEEEIKKRCEELTGTYDVSRFTDKKGMELKEKIRSVEIEYDSGKLKFLGNSFMPKQVRIMSAYILTNSYEPLMGKYLVLEKIYLKKELNDMYIHSNKEIKTDFIPNLIKAEKLGEKINIFYVSKDKKAEFIGKNGNNIKKLRKEYGEILVREV